ncbi:MAG TPA: DUF2490 domain-containing protein [Parafilimonas sp.]|nr:DUF2490 domain-containing protein [Parafilimonas sp.]
MQRWLLTGFLLLAAPFSLLYGQTNSLGQFWNEFSFSRAAFKRSGLEFNFGQSWTATPDHSSMFAENAQIHVRGWWHYYYSSRWKFSFFLAYYSNKDVPEIKQNKAPEIRPALQAMYFFKKIPYTLNARVRLEDRNIKNDSGKYETTIRLRTQFRCVYPFNDKIIGQGTIYGIASDELMFKTGTNVAGSQFFDRNRFTIGCGYSITSDIQLEITYVNEYLPRPSTNELHNVLQVKMNFINLFANVKKALLKKPPSEPAAHD